MSGRAFVADRATSGASTTEHELAPSWTAINLAETPPAVPPTVPSEMPPQALEFWTLGCVSGAIGRRFGTLARVRELLPTRSGVATR